MDQCERIFNRHHLPSSCTGLCWFQIYGGKIFSFKNAETSIAVRLLRRIRHFYTRLSKLIQVFSLQGNLSDLSNKKYPWPSQWINNHLQEKYSLLSYSQMVVRENEFKCIYGPVTIECFICRVNELNLGARKTKIILCVLPPLLANFAFLINLSEN